MSRRMNMSGYSMARMRSLFRSGDHEAVERVAAGLVAEHPDWSSEVRERARGIVERAIMDGVPFPGLELEDHLHFAAACEFVADGQEHLYTVASTYGADALERGLWPKARKYGGPEVRAFIRGMVTGVPLFGQSLPEEEEVYAAVSLAKLRAFRPGLVDLRDQLVYRHGSEDQSARFSVEFCGWIDEIIDAGLDLWYVTG